MEDIEDTMIKNKNIAFTKDFVKYSFTSEDDFNRKYKEVRKKFKHGPSKPILRKTYNDLLLSKDIIPKWNPGKRKMIDMAVMVRSYYWHPLMKGSNSIKKVLPAIMQHSKFIQHKYSQPIYGKGNLINSLNFEDKSWVEYDKFGSVKDPYKTLPLFDQFLSIDVKNIDKVFESDSVADGGAAMTAWAYMQFGHMSDKERKVIANALKFYCELDTMAMVIIMEAWRDMVSNSPNT